MWDNAAVFDLSAGQVVADKYRIDGVIGAGGMGVVVAATHLDLDQKVAIKLLRDASTDAVARFQREARLIVRLKSEHVARVFDVGTLDDDTPYIVMERLEGEDLARMLAKRGPLPVEQAVDYVVEACEAVAEAHTLGMVHRDLKPANIFVARGPGGTSSVKVLDFGVSKSLEARGGADDAVGELTNEGVALGSPGYMSPEQITSSRDVDARADIYSLGAILYRLVSGATPHKGDTLMSVLASMAAAPIPPLSILVPKVPPAFSAIVERCLSQDRNARPASIAELAQALVPFGSRRARASTEQILATMGVPANRSSDTMSAVLPAPPPREEDEVHDAPTGRASERNIVPHDTLDSTVVTPITAPSLPAFDPMRAAPPYGAMAVPHASYPAPHPPHQPSGTGPFIPASAPPGPAGRGLGLWPYIAGLMMLAMALNIVLRMRREPEVPLTFPDSEPVVSPTPALTTTAPASTASVPVEPSAARSAKPVTGALTAPTTKALAPKHTGTHGTTRRPDPAPTTPPTSAPPSPTDMPGGRH